MDIMFSQLKKAFDKKRAVNLISIDFVGNVEIKDLDHECVLVNYFDKKFQCYREDTIKIDNIDYLSYKKLTENQKYLKRLYEITE